MSYSPAMYSAGSIPRPILSAPSGPAPPALPSSANYVSSSRSTFTSSMRGMVAKLTSKAEKSWNEQTDARFRRYFALPFTELLYGEFWGVVWNNGRLVPCSVYLSTHYLCIEAKVKDPVTRVKSPLTAKVLLSDIVRIQPAISLPSMTGGDPVIQAVTDPAVRADSIQIYTNDGKLHQLSHFFSFDKFLRILEYLWWSSSSIPNVQQAGGPITYQQQLPSTTTYQQPSPYSSTTYQQPYQSQYTTTTATTTAAPLPTTKEYVPQAVPTSSAGAPNF